MKRLAVLPLLALAACSHGPTVPKEVRVPVPVPCEIDQVPATELPSASDDAGIFDRAKVAAARIKLLMAENERLRAANNSPCTTPKEIK